MRNSTCKGQVNKVCRLALLLSYMWLPILAKSQKVRSFYPLVSEDNAIVQPGIEGTWIFKFLSDDTLSIVKKGDNFYHLDIPRTSLRYEAMIGNLKDLVVLQLLPLPPKSDESTDFKTDFIPIYTFYKAEFNHDTLQLADINYKQLFERIKKDTSIQYSWLNDAFIFNMSPARLRQFIGSTVDHEKLFDSKMNFVRARPGSPLENRKLPSKTIVAKKHPASVRQDCLPSFPLKKGWFGGDGNVSVAISPNKTLWLFSDSFVGREDQQSRPGSSIIANSVGVMNCERSGYSTIEYYWNDRFSPSPKPIFQSFTNRYKFWINDALLYDSTLYVVLDKIGPRSEPTAVNETFNFEHLGWSLASVGNPFDSPDEWQISYLPLPGIGDRQWNGQIVTDNGYVYLFFRKDSASTLARFPVEFIGSPVSKLQYYTKEDAWKAGATGGDAAILFHGDDCQTVEYHPGLRKWIMIIGPGFWSSKIRMRQAAKLTGPWSDEETIYECPEQTPGSPSFHKDNFCYLGREHIQFYDPGTRTMVLTYDHNTINFEKLVADTTIYVPKVISVKLKK